MSRSPRQHFEQSVKAQIVRKLVEYADRGANMRVVAPTLGVGASTAYNWIAAARKAAAAAQQTKDLAMQEQPELIATDVQTEIQSNGHDTSPDAAAVEPTEQYLRLRASEFIRAAIRDLEKRREGLLLALKTLEM